MLFSIGLWIVIFFAAYKTAPREKKESALVHGAGQVGFLAAVALFGVDYFTSYYYATGEMMTALHPYGLQKYAVIPVLVIALANFIFGALYMYSLGVFREGGGSFTAAMRYLGPSIQDLQAMAWRNVAIGEIPEIVVYRNAKGTFTRPVTAAVVAAIVIQLLVRGDPSLAIPYYGVGVFLPIMAMGLAIRRQIILSASGRKRFWGTLGATAAATLAGIVFVGQIVGKWSEGGWVVLISLSVLILMAHAILLSPIGYRTPVDIHRIVRDKSRVEGRMGNMVEWQSLKVQEYRYGLMVVIAKFWEWFGVRRPTRFEPPILAGAYEAALDQKGTETFLDQYLGRKMKREPRLGSSPKETAPVDKEGKEE